MRLQLGYIAGSVFKAYKAPLREAQRSHLLRKLLANAAIAASRVTAYP
jgi:hypothetical protein